MTLWSTSRHRPPLILPEITCHLCKIPQEPCFSASSHSGFHTCWHRTEWVFKMPCFLGFWAGLGHELRVRLKQLDKDRFVPAHAYARYRGFHWNHLSTHASQEIFFPREGNVWVGPHGICLGKIWDLYASIATPEHHDLCLWLFFACGSLS